MSHSIISGNKSEQLWAKVDRGIVWEGNNVKLLGITLDNNLRFDKHVSNICLKTNRTISALTRLAKFLSFKKRRVLFKAFIVLQFEYFPLVWMFNGRQDNDKINYIHERALRIVYNETMTSFEKLLVKDKTNNASSKYSIIGNRNA